jgi:hypothetical protein
MRVNRNYMLAALMLLLVSCSQDHWVELKPKDGGFVVSLPGRPSEKHIDQDLPLGHLKVVQYVITTNEVTFAVDYTEYPSTITEGRTPDAMLDLGIDRMFSAYPHGRKESIKTTLHGFPARNFTVDDPDTGYITAGSVCLVGKRNYVIQVVRPSKLDAKRDSSRFLKSFHFISRSDLQN